MMINSEGANHEALLEQAALRTLAEAHDSRPARTKITYKGPIKEFSNFCIVDYGFIDGDTVTEAKVNLFLTERVIGRLSRKGRNKGKEVGIRTIDNYVSALVSLYNEQKSRNMNSNDHPRGKLVKQLLETISRKEHLRKKTSYVDRGIGTMLDTYTAEELEQMALFFLNKNSLAGLQNRAMHSISHSTLMRGQLVRKMELPDIHTVTLPSEGVTPADVLICISNNGKTNQFGKLEFFACLRAKNVCTCPISAVAFFLFFRYHVDDEPFPDFSQPENWYDFKLFNTSSPLKGVAYTTHNDFISDCFNAVGIISSRKTHSGRGSGVLFAEMAGCSENSLRRLGNWNQTNALDGCYLRSLPRKALRSMAGFTPNGSIYELDRAVLSPPEELQQMIFPDVEYWLRRQYEGLDEKNLATVGFLKALICMRIIILQDSVGLKSKCPSHPMWKHSIFQCTEYKKFEIDLQLAIGSTSCTNQTSLQTVVPEILSAIEVSHGSLSTRMEGVIQSNCHVVESVNELQLNFQDVVSGRAAIRLTVDRSAHVEANKEHMPAKEINVEEATPLTIGIPFNADTPVQQYRMSRHISSVAELWREFYVGLGGGPSINSLEHEFRNKWRRSAADSKYFSKRKLIIDKVISIANSRGIMVGEAIKELDHFCGERSLDWLAKNRNSY